MIRIKQLGVSYDRHHPILQDISLAMIGPSITGIIGPNGAGKSTFMKAVLGLIDHSGSVEFLDQTGKPHQQAIAYVEQRSQIDFDFPITVKECVSLGLYKKIGLFRRVGKKDWAKVSEALEKVGLSDFEEAAIKHLSGGQFQRMLLARCLVQDADYIFLDEPFVGIDSISEQVIIRLLKELKEAGKTILIVHHDLSKVQEYFDHTLILNKELIAYGPVGEAFTSRSLKKAYGDTIYLGEEYSS